MVCELNIFPPVNYTVINLCVLISMCISMWKSSPSFRRTVWIVGILIITTNEYVTLISMDLRLIKCRIDRECLRSNLSHSRIASLVLWGMLKHWDYSKYLITDDSGFLLNDKHCISKYKKLCQSLSLSPLDFVVYILKRNFWFLLIFGVLKIIKMYFKKRAIGSIDKFEFLQDGIFEISFKPIKDGKYSIRPQVMIDGKVTPITAEINKENEVTEKLNSLGYNIPPNIDWNRPIITTPASTIQSKFKTVIGNQNSRKKLPKVKLSKKIVHLLKTKKYSPENICTNLVNLYESNILSLGDIFKSKKIKELN